MRRPLIIISVIIISFTLGTFAHTMFEDYPERAVAENSASRESINAYLENTGEGIYRIFVTGNIDGFNFMEHCWKVECRTRNGVLF